MDEFMKMLKSQEIKYRKMIDKAESFINEDIKGSLEIHKSNQNVRYYLKTKNPLSKKLVRKYIPKENIKLIKALANKAYYKSIKKDLVKRYNLLKNLNDEISKNNIEQKFNSLHPDRQELIDKLDTSYEEKLKIWKTERYKGKLISDEISPIRTNKDEIVRSKSEKILADKFYELGIDYKYERPLYLENNHRVFPDFTFLSPFTCEEIYWEHFGMMSNPSYAENAIKKIIMYQDNDIYIGKNLICTFEAANYTFDYKFIEFLIKKYLVK